MDPCAPNSRPEQSLPDCCLIARSQTALRTTLKVLATESISDRDGANVVDFKPAKVFAASSGLDETGLHALLQLVSRYSPDQLTKISLATFKELFRAYTEDDQAHRALNLKTGEWKGDEACKSGIAARLAPLVIAASGFSRYEALSRS